MVFLAAVTTAAGCGDSSVAPFAPSPTPTALTVARIEPNTGPTGSPVPVTIHGSGFQTGATSALDGIALTLSSVTSTQMTATVPPHAEGAVDLVVTNPGGASVRLAGAYSYVPVAITSVSPRAAFLGTMVRIIGTGFLAGATVTFDGVVAISSSVTATSITLVAPAHGSGTVDVVVTNPGGQSATLSGGFTYTNPTLTVAPTEVAQGAEVTLTWTALTPSTSLDWIGLFRIGAANVNYLEDHWDYTGGATSGTWRMRVPREPGQYEFRYLLNDGYVDVARSAAITVRAN
jgi:hypothetical protein